MGRDILAGGSWRTAICAAALVLVSPVVAHAQKPALELPTFAPPASISSALAPLQDPVAPFVLAAGEQTRARALHCLTQAVYYEAASEPRAGQEAVAQVVLNRLKHPAFPKSVCGVVYEGAERETGCQFTFTCDGSLARAPSLERWDEAEQVAAAALDGHVASDVGASTHYHAAWMTPYWSASLVRTRRIGGHVFYRMPGEAGSPEALTGQYAGAEPAAPEGLAAQARPIRVKVARPRRAPPAGNGVTEFSVWGLQVATVTTRHGEVTVKSGS